MAQHTERAKFDEGDGLGRFEGKLLGGGMVTLPDDFAGHWGIILIYRGHW